MRLLRLDVRCGRTCVGIPALGPDATIPARASARTPFAIGERFGLIWIAPDQPIVGLPNFPEWDDPSSTML